MSELHLVGFFYRLLEHISILNVHGSEASTALCQRLLAELHEQSVTSWPPPKEAVSMAIQLDLLDERRDEMIVVLPENLFQGLHEEQKHARIVFQADQASAKSQALDITP